MDQQRLVKISKYLSKHLRHQPERLGLTLEPGGWVAVDTLLKACKLHGFALDRAELDEVVQQNDKQRFAFDQTGTRIRAQQGHSVPIDLGLEAMEPPATLYHGTAQHFVQAIRRDGLHKMRRHHVHLSSDVATATHVGARHGPPVVFAVAAGAMYAAGFTFYCSGNGVWLVDHVPPAYLHML